MYPCGAYPWLTEAYKILATKVSRRVASYSIVQSFGCFGRFILSKTGFELILRKFSRVGDAGFLLFRLTKIIFCFLFLYFYYFLHLLHESGFYCSAYSPPIQFVSLHGFRGLAIYWVAIFCVVISWHTLVAIPAKHLNSSCRLL